MERYCCTAARDFQMPCFMMWKISTPIAIQALAPPERRECPVHFSPEGGVMLMRGRTELSQEVTSLAGHADAD